MNRTMPPLVRAATSIATLATLAVVTLSAGCAEEIRSEDSGETDVAAEEIRPMAVYPTSAADGARRFDTNLYSERDADLYNRLMIEETSRGGIPITAIHVEVGNRVRAGQLLASLESSDARLYVEAAEPRAEVAAANLRRIEQLRQTGAVSEVEYEDAVFEARSSQAALEQAQLNLSRTEIRAPFTGVVSRRYVRVGDVVDDETPLFRVTAMSPLRARLLVPESEVSDFPVGAPVEITGADGTTGTARVIIVGPTVDPGSGSREVIVELARVGDFRPGASVTARRLVPDDAPAGDAPDDEGSDAADATAVETATP